MQGTSQNAPKLNAGLNLKFNKTNKEVRHNVNSEYTMMHCDRMSGHLATSEMWCWSGARRILTELSLCYSIVYRYSVVVSGSSPVSSTHHWSNNRLIYCDAICNSSWPWHLRHLVPVNAVISNGLFCNASLFYVSCVQSGGRYQLQCSSRLLLCSIGVVSLCQRSVWTSCQPHPAPPVCSECCCTAHLQNQTIRAYYFRSHQPSLAARPRVHLLQIGCPDVPINPRHFV